MSDIKILELSLKHLTDAFDRFLVSCMDEQGKPKAPQYKDLMRARGYLPKGKMASLEGKDD